MNKSWDLKARSSQPTAEELSLFIDWLAENGISQDEYDPLSVLNQNQDYDYLSAFREGDRRNQGSSHFTDKHKLPYHPTFSTQSEYYKEGMPAVEWIDEENYLPAGILGRFRNR